MESYLFKKISEIFSGEFKSSVLQQKKVVALAGEGFLLKIGMRARTLAKSTRIANLLSCWCFGNLKKPLTCSLSNSQQLGYQFIFLHQSRNKKKHIFLRLKLLEFVCVGFFQKTPWKKTLTVKVPDLLYSHLKITAMACVSWCYCLIGISRYPLNECHPPLRK